MLFYYRTFVFSGLEFLLKRHQMHTTLNLKCIPIYSTCQRRQWHPTLVCLPGKSHGRRGLVGCSPWGCEESDMTERLHFHFSLSCTGEGNGSPLQYSCLENPREGRAWWAAIYGVTQSWARLKWLSSSTSIQYMQTNTVWFPLHKVLRIVKPIESENILVDARGQGVRWMGS